MCAAEVGTVAEESVANERFLVQRAQRVKSAATERATGRLVMYRFPLTCLV